MEEIPFGQFFQITLHILVLHSILCRYLLSPIQDIASLNSTTPLHRLFAFVLITQIPVLRRDLLVAVLDLENLTTIFPFIINHSVKLTGCKLQLKPRHSLSADLIVSSSTMFSIIRPRTSLRMLLATQVFSHLPSTEKVFSSSARGRAPALGSIASLAACTGCVPPVFFLAHALSEGSRQ